MTEDELCALAEKFRNTLSVERLEEEIGFVHHMMDEVGHFRVSKYGTYLISLPAGLTPDHHYFTTEVALLMLETALRLKEL